MVAAAMGRCLGLALMAASAAALPLARMEPQELTFSATSAMDGAALEAISMEQLEHTLAATASESFGHQTAVSISDTHRRLQSGVTNLNIRYTISCTDDCDAISAVVSDAAVQQVHAAALIDSITAVADGAGFSNAVQSTASDIAASIVDPETVTITLPPAPEPNTGVMASIAPGDFTLTGNAALNAGVVQITQTGGGQQGTAFAPVSVSAADDINVAFDMYTGDGNGADGLCMNLGAGDMGGRYGEDGVAVGFALCFDEWSNGAHHGGHNDEAGDNGDHGIIMFQDGQNAWNHFGDCPNRQACLPVSAFETAAWIGVTVRITSAGFASFNLDADGVQAYSAESDIAGYTLPSDVFIGFSGRTGGATNNHWVRNVMIGTGAAPPAPFYGCSSRWTCQQLGEAYLGAWRNPAGRGSAEVCGESDAGFYDADGAEQCFGGLLPTGAGEVGADGWGHAQTICFAMGARLCSTEELQADETRGSGCNHDAEWVWAAEQCPGGHLVAAGGSHTTPPPCEVAGACGTQCSSDDTPHAIRCCADTDTSVAEPCDGSPFPAPGCSSQSCDALNDLYGGWPTGRGDPLVCGESDNGLHQNGEGGNQCSGDDEAAHDGWVHANALCTSVGARLCTTAELLADETRGTGCGHDGAMTWSSESCDAGYLTAVGSSAQAANRAADGSCADAASCTACTAAEDTTPAVRCCADVYAPTCSSPTPPPPFVAPPALPDGVQVWLEDGCHSNSVNNRQEAYVSAPTESVGEVQCCGNSWSDANGVQAEGTCQRMNILSDFQCISGNNDASKFTYYEAESMCAAQGMRLCTKQETLSESAAGCCGTGCQYDNVHVWTSTTTRDEPVPGCAEVTVGSGPVVGQLFDVPAGMLCPADVSRDNWLGADTWGDTFLITQDAGYDYIGCFADNTAGARDLPFAADRVSGATVPEHAAQCLTLCTGYAYFGLQWSNECFCGNSYGSQGDPHEGRTCTSEGFDAEASNYADLCANGQNNCGNTNAVYEPGASTITVTRTDTGNLEQGWGMNLRIECCNEGITNPAGPTPPPPPPDVGTCEEVTIGSGPVVGTVFPVTEGLTCPTLVTRDNWNGGDTWGDTFEITQDAVGITVIRTDTGNTAQGWGMNLRFDCCAEAPSCVTAQIGSGPVVGQAFPIAAGHTCPADVNIDVWLGGHTYGDTFSVTQDNTYDYLGCFADNNGARDLTGLQLTVNYDTVAESATACAGLCAGFTYFGLQWANECFCGNTYGSQGLASDRAEERSCT
eukprot:SAG22_NODE_220_length_14862_cov_73.769424_1_plen_1257_part_10